MVGASKNVPLTKDHPNIHFMQFLGQLNVFHCAEHYFRLKKLLYHYVFEHPSIQLEVNDTRCVRISPEEDIYYILEAIIFDHDTILKNISVKWFLS